jgi:3-methyl-2-oxobutanoate hydroxymethyltransferase
MSERKAVTVPALRARKHLGPRITMLTAYDVSMAAALSAGGVDCLLVGDSLGMVVQGESSTVPVSVADVAYHTRAVARGAGAALVIADLPYLSYATLPQALDAAQRLMQAGAQMVKLEGGGWTVPIVAALAERDVPVCAHLGLTPQSVHQFGGFRVQGRDAAAAGRIRQQAQALAEAGAAMLVLECVPAVLAAQITAELPIPTIGIGAGADCDGQVLVCYDLLGMSPGLRPRFVQNFLLGQDSVQAAAAAYCAAVRDGTFPGPQHAYA